MGKKSHPHSITELNSMVEQFRGRQEKRVQEFRRKKHTDDEKKSTKADWWDMPLTVCSCASLAAPFIAANGRNCSALKQPHPVLLKAYYNIVNNSGEIIGSIPIGQKPDNKIKKALQLTGEDSFEAGRCAEQHAANRLLNHSGKISDISQIVFSVALDSRYPTQKPYCVTCKSVFPILR